VSGDGSPEPDDVGERIRAAMAVGPPGPTLADLEHHDIEGNPIPDRIPVTSPVTVETLTDWLLRQVAEDEWVSSDDDGSWWSADQLLSYSGGALGDSDVLHIARWDPARVLAECESKRRLIALHIGADDWHACPDVDGTDERFGQDVRDRWCPTLRLLALPYADRPGYQETWRP
jgi:hypothetical protein